MRFMKWISMLTVFAMLFAMLPATVAEDEIVIGMDESADGEIEIDLDAFDDSSVALENDILDLDGLEENLLIPEEEEYAEASTASNTSGDFEIDEEGTLVRYGGFEKNVVIPDGVKEIGSSAFENYTDLESVSIPSSVTSIDDDAFCGCTGLKTINMPESVTYIGSYAFSGCTALTSIELPDSITDLGKAVFKGCTSLTNIQLPATMTELPRSMFSDCDGLNNFTIPNSVISIYEYAFSNCSNLESVTIHAGVSFIDRMAFDGSNNVVIRGTAGSYAETYANGVGIPFNAPVVTIKEETEWIYDDEDYEAIIMYINQSLLLTAFQKPTDLARTLSWSSSDNNIATVDQNGTVKAVSQGIVTISVNTADGMGKAAQIKVLVPEPTSIEIYDDWDIEDNEIILGETETIQAYKESPYENIAGVEMPITWSSSNKKIISIEATEDDEATLKANKPGKVTITATTPDGGKASVKLKVVRPEAENVKIDQTGPIKLYVGQKYALSATVSPAEAEAKLTWSSNDKKVATVNQDGVVTAVREGYADIYVEIGNDYDDSIEIEVLPTPTKITLNRKKATLGVKERLKLKVNFTPQDVKTPLTWKSSKPKVAAVSKNGVVTPKKPGTAVITVRTKNGKTAKATITVKAAPKSVALNKTGTVELKKGRTLKLKATLPKDTASALTWTSSRPKVASVDQKGNVRALKKGTAVITVKTFNGKTAKVTVAVK